jgi:O-succinylbenzoic acid--CoA ligase
MSFCVYREDDLELGETLIAIFESEPFSKSDEKNLKEETTKLVSKYEVPRRIYFTDKLIYSSSGKIDRSASFQKIRIRK